MATPRYLYGDARPHVVPIATAQDVDIGDLVGLASGTLEKASDTTWDTDLATTQTAFAVLFLGVSAQQKAADVARVYGNGTDGEIRVDCSGVYEMDCASASFVVGDFVGPAKDTGNALLDDKVVEVASEALAIGRVVEAGTSVTRVKFQILSKILPAARQA